MKNCAVIGAGIAGLAAAIRLAAKGHQVHVFEANAVPGGKIKQQYAKGYRFDMGPSVITLPNLIDELFELHNKNPRDYFEYSFLEKPFKYFFPDGFELQAHADVNTFADEIEAKTCDTKQAFLSYLKNAEKKYEITKPVFIESSIHRSKDFLNAEVVKGVFNVRKIDAFESMNDSNKKFFNDAHLVTLFNNYATYVGSNPFTAPATLNVIQHLEISRGLAMPKKGIYSLIEALFSLAKEVGVSFTFNATVDEILVVEGRARGVKVGGETHAFDAVVSNMDVYFTYKKLLPKSKVPKRVLSQKKSSSVLAFYWGVNKEFPELSLHNMLFTGNQQKEFEAVFKEKSISNDPTIYICITSKNNTEDAPKRKENWYVLVTAPFIENQDWDVLVKNTRKHVIAKINAMLNTSIEDFIEFEDCLTPKIIEENYKSAFGSVYGNSSNSKFSAFMRHGNFSRKIKDLYFVGGSVHPGAGIPMCLNSAKILMQVLED